MRAFFLIALTLFASITTNAQLVANAGPDKANCWNADNNEDPILGADTVASGGTAPYTYKWEAHDIVAIGPYSWHYFASYFLTDTTAANPVMINYSQNEEVVFKLTVTDANNQISIDTVVVKHSTFSWTLDYWEFTIHQGESIYLQWGAAAYSDRPPFQFYWHPTHGLSDSTSETFWAHPDHSIRYFCKVTDALGCYVDAGRYTINVIPVSTNDIELVSASIFPNPASNRLNFKLDEQLNQPRELNIYSLDGKLIYRQAVETSEFSTDISVLHAGEYLYRISGNGKKVYSGLFLKE